MKNPMIYSPNIVKEIIQISQNPEETYLIAKNIANKLQGSELIGVSGELGVGKTLFASGIACGLGVKELVTSPTFLGISEYYSGRLPFIHMDFYKKVTTSKIIENYLNKNSVILIEWIENFYEVMSQKLNIDIEVKINYGSSSKHNENYREIIIKCSDHIRI